MSAKNQPNQHHFIPRTYLNQFKIDNIDGSFIYCFSLVDQYRRFIQKLGLNHAVFKKDKYYHHSSLNDPYSIEKIFSEIENDYNQILSVIKSEKSITKITVEKLLQWIFISRMRSPVIRNNIRNKLIFLNNFRSENDISQIEEQSKIEHLSIFFDLEKLNSIMWPFIGGINAKHWKILIAPENYSFLGCDNPGFLINFDPNTRRQEPYKQFIKVDADSLVYYVLSKRYCLEISFFEKGTPLDKCAMNMSIEFEPIDTSFLDLINKGTFLTAYELVFCDNQKQLQFVEDIFKL